MNPKVLLSAGIALIIVWGGIWFWFFHWENIQDSKHSETYKENSWEKQNSLSQEDIQTQMQIVRNRLALKGLIIQWDRYMQEWQTAIALKKYLDFYAQNPNDTLILKKIAKSYETMGKYENAIKYYNKIEVFDTESREAYLWILEKTLDFSQATKTEFFLKEIQKFKLSSEDMFYYETSILCSYNFDECQKEFEDYFIAWVWVPGFLESQKLKSIEQALQNYNNFQLTDEALKKAYIIWAWYANSFYSLSKETGKQILEEKTDYLSVIKIVAQSYFQIWEYANARKYLNMYNEKDSSDPWVQYLLGICNTKLKDFVLANIFFSNALKLDISDSLNVRRYMIQNFQEVGSYKKMLWVFRDILTEETDYDAEDGSLAVYYHILHDETDTALRLTQELSERFPDETDFYTYHWWILRERWELDAAQDILMKWYEKDSQDAFLLLNLWYLKQDMWESSQALTLFKKILASQFQDEFYFAAQEEIENFTQ